MSPDLLGLQGLRAVAVRDESGQRRVQVEGLCAPAACPDCRHSRLHGHGTQQQTFADCPTAGQITVIEIDRKRYRCQGCGKTQFEPLLAVDDKRLATRRLVQYIEQRCLKKTFLSLAQEVGLDDKTIRGVFNDYVARVQKAVRFETPEFLGIDEIKIVGDYRAVITNVEKKTLYDLRETRKKSFLIDYFNRLPDKDKVRWVAMDMWNVYRQVVEKCLPEARIVVDKFHIQRMANEALEKVRKKVRKEISVRQRLKLKDDRFILLKRLHNLTSKEYETLKGWIDGFPMLGQAHALKEGFFAIWDAQNRADAEAAYDKWRDTVPEDLRWAFRLVIQAVDNWRKQVFNYFDCKITNAYTESVNNLIKSMNRMGRGYSFEVIRARMLYDQKALKDGAAVILEREEEPPMTRDLLVNFGKFETQSQRVRRRVVYYGAYIPTLVKQLNEGHFE